MKKRLDARVDILQGAWGWAIDSSFRSGSESLEVRGIVGKVRLLVKQIGVLEGELRHPEPRQTEAVDSPGADLRAPQKYPKDRFPAASGAAP